MFERLKRLNGSHAKPEALAAALAELDGDLAKENGTIEPLQHRRQQALLDESFAAAEKLEADIKRAKDRVASLKLQRPLLEEDLAAAQAKAAKDAEAGLVAEDQTLFERYSAGLRVLAEIDRERSELQARARQIVGHARANVLLPTARIYQGYVTAEHIDPWIERQARELRTSEAMSRAPAGASAARPAAPRPTAKPRQSPDSTQHGVRLGVDDHGAIGHTEPLPNHVGPLKVGHVWMRVVNSGYPDPVTGKQCQGGRKIQVERETARAAVANKALEYCDAPEPPSEAPAAAAAVAPLTAPPSEGSQP